MSNAASPDAAAIEDGKAALLPVVPLAPALALASALVLTSTLVPFIAEAAVPTTPLACDSALPSARSATFNAVAVPACVAPVPPLVSALALSEPEPLALLEALAPRRAVPSEVPAEAAPFAAPVRKPA